MAQEKCGCGSDTHQGGCQACSAENIFAYFCTNCNRSVPEKRCPYCGLKSQKKK